MGYFIEYDARASFYSVQAAFQLNAEVFDRAGASDKLEGFASFHGPDHYQLPRNIDRITLTRRAWSVPDAFPFDGGAVIPFRASGTLAWSATAAATGA
jgi:dihydroorotase